MRTGCAPRLRQAALRRGAWNLPLFQIYGNPFNTPGLVIDPGMHGGFEFEVLDVYDHKSIRLRCPEETYDVGKDDPVPVTRCQSGLPSVGETLEPFASSHLVEGWMRGSHRGPLMPVSFAHATASRFDGPPRVIAAGFQVAEGKLVGPRDLFDDPAFDRARATANEMADYLRRHGPFEPHRLGLDDMEYTTMPGLMRKLEGRWVKEKD